MRSAARVSLLMRNAFALMSLTLLCISAGGQAIVANDTPECSTRYFLDNDENFHSEVSFTVLETCRRQFLSRIAADPSPSIEDRYLAVKLLPGDDKAPRLEGYKRLCLTDRHARSCSGAANILAVTHSSREELAPYLELAIQADIPAALVSAGGYEFVKFRTKTGDLNELCAAKRLWQRAAQLGDAGGQRMLARLNEAFPEECSEF